MWSTFWGLRDWNIYENICRYLNIGLPLIGVMILWGRDRKINGVWTESPAGGEGDTEDKSDQDLNQGRQTLDASDSEDGEELPVFLWRPPQSTAAFGEWEAHTRARNLFEFFSTKADQKLNDAADVICSLFIAVFLVVFAASVHFLLVSFSLRRHWVWEV